MAEGGVNATCSFYFFVLFFLATFVDKCRHLFLSWGHTTTLHPLQTICLQPAYTREHKQAFVFMVCLMPTNVDVCAVASNVNTSRQEWGYVLLCVILVSSISVDTCWGIML